MASGQSLEGQMKWGLVTQRGPAWPPWLVASAFALRKEHVPRHSTNRTCTVPEIRHDESFHSGLVLVTRRDRAAAGFLSIKG